VFASLTLAAVGSAEPTDAVAMTMSSVTGEDLDAVFLPSKPASPANVAAGVDSNVAPDQPRELYS
jgi:hypothetical protein